jgi:DNA-binding Lrp family transcriptional regulator
MAVKGYVLIETEVGTAKAVAEKLNDLREKDVRVTGVDTVTGPFDVIAMLQANDLNDLGSCITQTIQVVSGVKRTTTCLSVSLD